MTRTGTVRTPHRRAALAVALVAAAGLLAGCSSSSGAADESAVGSDAGGAADSAEVAPEGAAADLATAQGADESARQVVQTGTLRLTVDDPRAAADTVVDLAEGSGGRVDSRSEHAATDDQGGAATLTIRVPASQVTATVDAIRELGRLDSVDLDAQDVTAAAQDLDARIRGLELSVARMSDLLARTTTTEDVVAAENALAERQTRLEELQSQRARLADAVALSTLTVELYGPGIVPAATPGPRSFLDGLAVGWQSFVVVVQGFVVVLGVLLPWLAFAGAVTAGVVALVRWRRRAAGPDVAPPAPPAAPGPSPRPAPAQTSPETTP